VWTAAPGACAVTSSTASSRSPTAGSSRREREECWPTSTGKIQAGRGGRVTADLISGWRKVRAPKSRALGNTQSGRLEGKCHRNYTAVGRRLRRMAGGKGEMVG